MHSRAIKLVFAVLFTGCLAVILYYIATSTKEIHDNNEDRDVAVQYAIWGTAAYYGTITYNRTQYTCHALHCYVLVPLPETPGNRICHIQSQMPIDLRQRPLLLPDCTLFTPYYAFTYISIVVITCYACVAFITCMLK